MLLIFFALLSVCFLACPADAGSRRWEMPLHQIRGNATLHAKRAISIVPGTSAGSARLWPDRTITYAFADSTSNTKLKALFFQGTEVWSRLKSHDFKYNLVSTSKCKADRLNCLMVHYNTEGKLGSTVAKPALTDDDSKYEGPIMHLSDSFAVGNRNPVINIAHEIGHAWGLLHEHQNEQRWKTSEEHKYGASNWLHYTGDVFHTNKFNCKALKDYEDVRAKLPQNDVDFHSERMCTSFNAASSHGFSAKEWLPRNLVDRNPDALFDPNSIMLYPSRAGASGDATETTDNRLIVMKYSDDSEIPMRQGASDWDISKLVGLYGTGTREQSEPYSKKGSAKENLFRKMRGESTRAGDTKGGLC